MSLSCPLRSFVIVILFEVPDGFDFSDLLVELDQLVSHNPVVVSIVAFNRIEVDTILVVLVNNLEYL